MEIISRANAKDKDLKRFYTGIPCIHGHDSERFVSDGRCLACNAAKMRRYWKKHPEKTKERNEKFRDRRKNSEWHQAYLAKRREKWATDKEWRNEQKRIMRRNYKIRYLDKAYRERIRRESLEYAKNNRPIMNARMARRRAALDDRTPEWANLEKIKDFYKCCPAGYHVDHCIPLRGKRVSGLHVLANLQYLPAAENLSKGNKFSGTTRKLAVVS